MKRSNQPLSASHASAPSSSWAAARQTSSTSSRYSASSSAWRLGKCRYSVPMPTPARRAIASSDVDSPPSANASRAAASTFS